MAQNSPIVLTLRTLLSAGALTLGLAGVAGAQQIPNMPGGFAGPDLSGEGLVQCYGWHNDGSTPAPVLADVVAACGDAVEITFAGHRHDGGYVRHDMTLLQEFSNYLPAGSLFVQNFETTNTYSWHKDANWILLVNYNNAWADPGRLWEPNISGGAAATDGHVLSQAGNNAHDQHLRTGDKYYIYKAQPDTDDDGVLNNADNCPANANPGQEDADGDGVGDACDACANDATNDADGDGVCQDVDNCPTVSNNAQTDDNGDGFGDACVSPLASIGNGVDLPGDVFVGPNADIGDFVQIGAGASIDGAVADDASIGAGSTVGTGCTIGSNTTIGANVGLGDNCAIGSRTTIGDDSTLGAGASVGARSAVGASSTMGADSSLGSNASIGAGSNVPDNGTIGDNSHLGSNAQLGAGSSVGPNTILGDNLTLGAGSAIGSNVRGDNDITIGANSFVRSQASIGGNLNMGAGSEIASGGVVGSNSVIGDGVEMRGEIRNAVTLEDNTFVGNQSSVGDNTTMRLNATVGQFVILGSGNDIGEDCAIFSGSELGNDCTVGARTQVLYRTSIGNEATIGTDNLIDEQIDIGNHFTLGNNSRLWPFSSFSDRVSVGDDVLIRNNALISDDVVIEDGVLLYPRTTIEEETIIRANVEIGVDDCRANGCGNVSIGGCLDISADADAFAVLDGSCNEGIVDNGGARSWSDGTYATACHEYRNPPEGYLYDDAGDGTYTIDPDGPGGVAPFDVYCEMTTDGGGWTLVDNDATDAATFSSRTLGANPDINVTRGALLPAYDWSDAPQLMCKSNRFTGNLGWLTFNVTSAAGLNYPFTTSIAGFGSGGHFSYGILNGNSQQGTASWLHNASSRFGSVWIGNGSQATCACNYYAPSPSTGLGNAASSTLSTCSTWIR